MRGNGSDQGGRWSVGLWLALVGVSAGTVASFSLIGWTFTRDLYDGGRGTEPLEFHSETVIIEAEETPEGVAGGDGELEGLVEPDSEPNVAASPAEPRAELVQDGAEDASEPPADEPTDARPESEETEPPQLVPVGEDDGECDRDEGALWPEAAYGENPVLRPLLETPETALDAASGLVADVEPGLMLDTLDTETSQEPGAVPSSDPGPGPDLDSQSASVLDPGSASDPDPHSASDADPGLEPGPARDGEPDLELDPALDPALDGTLDHDPVTQD